jgi:hypothetical protein
MAIADHRDRLTGERAGGHVGRAIHATWLHGKPLAETGGRMVVAPGEYHQIKPILKIPGILTPT